MALLAARISSHSRSPSSCNRMSELSRSELSRCMPGWRDRSPSRSKWNYVEQEADFKNTAQARASLVTPDPVCKALPVILHLVVLFRKERTKFALPKSGKSWGAGGHMVLM